jgi:probable phosphoglycerate mutase
MSINVYFVRHGQTYLNLYDRIQGWSDAPLTAKGRADAQRVADQLKNVHFDAAYSSDLSRTVITARTILAANISDLTDPIQEPDFREEFFGFFEGAIGPDTWKQIGKADGLTRFEQLVDRYTLEGTRDLIAKNDPFHDAEDDHAFWTRYGHGIDKLRQFPDGSTILVVSHGTAIRSIISKYAKQIPPVAPANGSITKVALTATTTDVNFYNQLTLP